ncbi:PTS lactose/cellobiose transporter subunit IIA [Spiroplasma culicicola]|uniref:PTS system cellobiose-specific IIA component n=1 Tax=Spiroplasma culicicola AES-1 TaxID=1276246 RepID=W6A642_9MOLU|nr:PTS lactose/cellobiose transporter subunit IIA [Spiroplasma culicicola]AHI52588.1 PTS system cellobiose-specific IIA component [Spiroplasma culicicola AES-1]
MSNKINWEEVSMGIITHSGMAKSNAVLAIRAAKEKDFAKAEQLMADAEKEMINAHNAHMDVVVQEAQGIQHDFKVLFMHAEDQMLTTQTLMVLAQEMIEMYKKIHG